MRRQIGCALIAFIFTAGAEKVTIEQRTSEITLSLSAARKALELRLSDESLWNGVENRQEVVQCLKLADLIKSPSIAPLIVRHISYTPLENHTEALTPIRERYPVVGTLTAIGTPAVPVIIDWIKKAKPDAALTDDEYRLCGLCLIAIYSESPDGMGDVRMSLQLMRRRVELELPKASETAKVSLNRLILIADSGLRLLDHNP